LSREAILSEIPDAIYGKSLGQWQAYLDGKGWELVQHHAGYGHPKPCAHLHQIIPGINHWIFEGEDGGIHDPNPVCEHCSPQSLKLSSYNVILTVTIKRRSYAEGSVEAK
jgi:hypothetical protein